jgi:hypothetical protein
MPTTSALRAGALPSASLSVAGTKRNIIATRISVLMTLVMTQPP